MDLSRAHTQGDDGRLILSVRFRDRALRLDIPTRAQQLRQFLECYFQPYFEFSSVDAHHECYGTIVVHLQESSDQAPSFSVAPVVDIDRSKNFLACRGRVVDEEFCRWVHFEPFQVLPRCLGAQMVM